MISVDSWRHISTIARRALIRFVNTGLGLITAALAGLVGAAATPNAWRHGRPMAQGHVNLRPAPNAPFAAVMAERKADGWFETSKQTVVYIDKEGDTYRALSATCSHLGCRVRWDEDKSQYRCPCHGGVYDRAGKVVAGPAAATAPPRQCPRQCADLGDRGRAVSLFSKLADWLDNRTGFRELRHHALDEPLPPGTGWWFTLGSLLLFGLGVQFLTGIALALYYAPTPDHAWDSVRFITNSVRGGSFVRACITGARASWSSRPSSTSAAWCSSAATASRVK
jgi:Rieske Fe-S protein